jgi:hypothetical protein
VQVRVRFGKPAAGHGRQPSAQSSRAATALASDDSEYDLNDAHARGRDGKANEHKHKHKHATDQPAFQVVPSLLLNSELADKTRLWRMRFQTHNKNRTQRRLSMATVSARPVVALFEVRPR